MLWEAGWERFPHTRGGGPLRGANLSRANRFPHTRGGGPGAPERKNAAQFVFPTRVGVDLCSTGQEPAAQCFPHTREGGPEMNLPQSC